MLGGEFALGARARRGVGVAEKAKVDRSGVRIAILHCLHTRDQRDE